MRSLRHTVTVYGLLLLSAALLSCGSGDKRRHTFTVSHINRYTPVKDQGRSQLCWLYAMLSTIETNHLLLGDSVHLSPYFPIRNYLYEQAEKFYSRQAVTPMTPRATALTAVRLLQQYGAMPYDSYRHGKNVNITVLTEKIKNLARQAIQTSTGSERYNMLVADNLDGSLGHAARNVYMFGAEYTPQEFARSVCAPDEYVGYTSFTHHPFYHPFVLEVPDNYDCSLYYNMPLQELTDNVCKAVEKGYAVCWEGDVSEPGFSFQKGIAVIDRDISQKDIQELRQREFENFSTTDDHCMSIIGLAHDERGTQYFILKNSWGTGNPYNGLMYMSFDYFKLKTIAVVMSTVSLQSTNHRHLQDREQYIYLR